MAKAFDKDTAGTLETSLIAWYNLSDTSDEFSTFTLTNVNTVTFSTGKIGDAADGGSSNTNKRLAYTADNMGIDGGVISLSAWVNVTTAPTSGNVMTFFAQASDTSDVMYKVDYYNDAGTLKVRWVRDRAGIATAIVTETATLTVGTWYHIILTYDGSVVEGFRDNVSKGTAAQTGNGSSALTNGIAILARTQADEFLSGLIDLVGIWSKELSATEISDLYNSGDGNAYRDQVTATSQSNLLMMGVG